MASKSDKKTECSHDVGKAPLGKVVESGQEHTGRWTKEEHEAFLSGLQTYGKEWKKVAARVKTRTVVQTRTHAQKYILKLQKKAASSVDKETKVIDSSDRPAKRQKKISAGKSADGRYEYATFTPSISAPSHAGCVLTPDVSICLDAYPPSAQSAHTCPHCTKGFSSKQRLDYHIEKQVCTKAPKKQQQKKKPVEGVHKKKTSVKKKKAPCQMQETKEKRAKRAAYNKKIRDGPLKKCSKCGAEKKRWCYHIVEWDKLEDDERSCKVCAIAVTEALVDELRLNLSDNEFMKSIKRLKVFPRFTKIYTGVPLSRSMTTSTQICSPKAAIPQFSKYYAGGPISGLDETPLGSRATSDALSGVTNETTNLLETPSGRNQSEAFTRRGGTSSIGISLGNLSAHRSAPHEQRVAQFEDHEQQYPSDNVVPNVTRYTVTFDLTSVDGDKLGIHLRTLDSRYLTVCMLELDRFGTRTKGVGPFGEEFKVQVGDLLVPLVRNETASQNTQALLDWFNTKSRQARNTNTSFDVSFWRPNPGSVEEKESFYQRIINKLKVSQDRDYINDIMYVSVSSVGTSQTINVDDAQGSCSGISLSIIEKHVMISGGFNMSGVTLDSIRESIDTDGPGLMQEVPGIEGSLVTDDEIIAYMQREQRLSKLHNRGVIHGNVLFLEDTLKICEWLSMGVGKRGGALFFNKHTVTILRSPSPYEPSQSNNEPYVYEFIESLPSDDHNGNGYRIVCTNLSSLHTVIIQYFYDKMRQMNDIDTIVKLPWGIEEVKQGDPRLFYVHYFAPPELPDPDEGKGEQPPNDSIIEAVDACFDNGSNTAVTYEKVSNILAIDVDSMTRGTKVAIDNRSRVLLSQPTVTAIKNVVDELYTRAIDDDFVSKESIIDEIVYRYKMNVELTDASCSVIEERMNAWLDDSTKAVAKLEECHNYEIVKAYPSILICAQEEQLHLNQLEEDLKRSGHSRISGHPRLVRSERTLFWKFEKGIPTVPHIKAILNGKQTQIEKLAVTGESVRVLAIYDYANAGFNRNQASIVNCLSQGDVDDVEIARKKYMKQMKTGGSIITVNANEKHCYRYKVPLLKSPVYTHEHILAIVNGTVEDVVEVFELPNIDTPLTPAQLGFDESEYISIEQCRQKFGVGLKHLAIKLRKGGFVRKHEDQMYWIQYKYPFKLRQATNLHPNSHVVELSKSELVIKCAEALRKKNAKSRAEIARRDCREVKRLSKSSFDCNARLVAKL